MTGDRLTLETDAARAIYDEVHDADMQVAAHRRSRFALAAVRAYRERAAADIPRDYIVAHQQLQRLVSAATPDGRLPNARCTDALTTVLEVNAAVAAVESLRGRCTRDAPDDGLRARVEAAMDEAGKLVAIAGSERPGRDTGPSQRAAWHRGQAARVILALLRD